MDPDKRRYRKLKRDVKRAGNRKRRRHLERELQANPGEAAHTQFDFGRNNSSTLNGNDHDATRRQHDAGLSGVDAEANEPEA